VSSTLVYTGERTRHRRSVTASSRNDKMLCACMVMLGYGLGVFSVLFFIAWLDEREDMYSNISYKEQLATCIEWSLVLQDIPVQKVSMKGYRSSSYRYKKNVERIAVLQEY